MAFFVVPIEVVLPSQTEATHAVVPDSGAGSVPDVSAAATDVATHAPFMDGEIITLTVNTAPVGGIAIIPWLVPLALRHNTVPIGKG